VENLNKDAQSITSNHRLFGQRQQKDKDIVIQLLEDMEIGEKELVHTTIDLEEAINHCTFY
jgi:hypothetical protein